MAKKPIEERFWAKVDKSGECWVWTGAVGGWGYGKFWSGGGKGRCMCASRMAWELTHGPIPTGMQVLHHCDNPPCVRPEHLFLGTNADNVRDKVSKGRQPRGAAVKVRPPRHTGEKHPQAKLTESGVRLIREKLAQGMTNASIAREMGVSYSTVSLIRRGRIWREVA